LGHVRWYDILVPNHDYQYYFNILDNSCPDKMPFFDNSWSYNHTHKYLQARTWRKYGELANYNVIDHATSPYNADWDYAERHGGGAALNNILSGLYASPPPPAPSPPWASLLASFTPDEDFVETYTLGVLTDPTAASPLQSLALNIPNYPAADVPGDLAKGLKTELTRKIACIAATNTTNITAR
jgi:hypothetical protein